MHNSEDWRQLLIQALERNKVDDVGALIEMIKDKNSVFHSNFISFIHKYANPDFVENNSREQWNIFLRDINNISRVMGDNYKILNWDAHYAENETEIETVNMKVDIPSDCASTKPFKNEELDWFEKKLQSLCSILPKKYREEFSGDLNEIRNSMKVRGDKKWWINLVSVLKFIPLIKAIAGIKLSDFLDPEQKTKEK